MVSQVEIVSSLRCVLMQDDQKILLLLLISSSIILPVRSDFGDADFKEDIEVDEQSYHDAWCRQIKNKYRYDFKAGQCG